MFGRKNKAITARSAGELDAMEAAGRIVGEALVAVRSAAKPGMFTLDLDEIAEDLIRGADAIPSFKGYEGFPGSVCTSVNDVVVHGIPSSAVVLSEGDLVSIDCGAILDGWHGDSAWTFGIGELSTADTALNDATAQVLAEGLKAMIPGNRLTDVSAALEAATRKAEEDFGIDLYIVDGFGGHGIGRSMHEDPQIPNFGPPGKGVRLEEGMVLAVEPMTTAGKHPVRMGDDGWSIFSQDGSMAAHFEFTIAITRSGPRVLTPWHDGRARVAA